MPDDNNRREEYERIAAAREKRRSAGRTLAIVILSIIVIILLAVLGAMAYIMMAMQSGREVNVPFLSDIIGQQHISSAEISEPAVDPEQAALSAVSEAPASTPSIAESAEPTPVPVTSETAPAETLEQPDAEVAAIKDIDPAALPEVGTEEEALAAAAAFATQYDYDSAVSVIKKLSGYENASTLTAKIDEYTAAKAACYVVDVTKVPHIFFHSLLNDDRGLRADVVGEDRAWKNDTAMATSDEYDHVIQQMYEAGYVLVSLDDMCVKTKDKDGNVKVSPSKSLLLPEGKKAFVLSVDDLSYYHSYGIGTQGYATRLVLDEEGKVKCEYTNEAGETLIGDYDVVPRLDTFIHEHPEFAYHNARGTVALTGYNGVFGYRTNDYYKDISNPKLDRDQVKWLENHPDFNFDEDVAAAKAIADAMKAEGWTFASHTYGHWNASTHTAEQLKEDNERWMTCNHEIIGDIDKIIFAFGGDIGPAFGYTADNPKFAYFKSQGYNIFCNVDGHAGWTEFGDDYMRTGRVPIDGFSMYQAMTPEGGSHQTYGTSYEILGIHDVDQFFNKNRIVPIETE